MKYDCTYKCNVLNNYLNICQRNLNKEENYITQNNSNNNFLKNIYKILNDIGDKITIVKEKTIEKSLNIEDNDYLPSYIKSYINNKRNVTHIKYKLNFYNKNVFINYYLVDNNKSEEELHNDINFLAQFVYLMYNITKYKHTNNIFYIYLTNFKKELGSNNIIDVQNINSGVCYFNDINRKVLIYREEEYIKVFIHEFLHSCHIDKYLHQNTNTNTNTNIYEKFNFDYKKTKITLNETYTEFWCNIIYISIFSYNLSKNSTINNYINIFDELMEKQVYFSVLQSVKILNIYNIKYLDTINNTVHNYSEGSHALSYYYFKSLLLFKYKNVMNMCEKNIIANETTKENIEKYLIKIRNNKKLIKLFNKFENELKKLNKSKKNDRISFILKNLYMCYIEI
tara:strand:+ start:9330 stop:10520 length:1191 start_codon:yes stop_codon:yes gene_type:complete